MCTYMCCCVYKVARVQNCFGHLYLYIFIHSRHAEREDLLGRVEILSILVEYIRIRCRRVE